MNLGRTKPSKDFELLSNINEFDQAKTKQKLFKNQNFRMQLSGNKKENIFVAKKLVEVKQKPRSRNNN